MSKLAQFQSPRYYHVDGAIQCLSYTEAKAHAANLSDYQPHRPVTVTRDPLVNDGVEVEGDASVCCFLSGKQVFPYPRA